MEKTYVTNNHLRAAIGNFQGYLDAGEDAPQDVFIEMMNELKVSNLIIPGAIEGDSLNFEQLVCDDDNSTALPLFTDDEEFIKQYGEDYEMDAIVCDFGYYLELLENVDTDGILINIAGEGFFIESEVILGYPFGPIASEDDEAEGYDAEKLLETAKNVKNESLLEFMKGGDGQFEALMLELEKASLLNVVSIDEGPDEIARDGIISADDVDGFDLCTASVDGGEYAILFTDVDAIGQGIADENTCFQLALLDELFEFVLTNDMDGIIINPSGNDYIIPRSYILEAYGGLTYDNPEFKRAIDYAFIL